MKSLLKRKLKIVCTVFGLLFLMIPVISSISCASAGYYASSDPNLGSKVFTGPFFGDPRLEIVSNTPLRRSTNFWLKQGDRLVARWDSYVLNVQQVGVACNFNTLMNGTSDCSKCNVCRADGMVNGSSTCFFRGVGFPVSDNVMDPTLFGFESGMENSNPFQTTNFLSISGCPLTDFNHTQPELTPDRTGTYTLKAPAASTENPDFTPGSIINDPLKRTSLVEARVVVVKSDPQPVQYELNRYTNGCAANTVWYKTSVPTNSIDLTENFSLNLRAGRVRIMKGIPDMDPSGHFVLKDATEVSPSRIIFLRGFIDGTCPNSHSDEKTQRCYARNSDPKFDLTNCRVSDTDPNHNYDTTPVGLKSNPSDLLTWFAEFNPAEGGVEPTFNNGEVLAIEFMIN